ncbi:FadR family transcriptional regulator [bacterium]|nr:FadR family transcriptional regulator [bacterium]
MRKLKKINIFEQVINSITAHIRDNHLRPGEKLPTEEEIAATLGVGRNSVREALKALQAMGLLEIRHGQGSYLRFFDYGATLSNLSIGYMIEGADMSDLTRVRCVLEMGFVSDVIRNMTAERLDKLREIVAAMEQSLDDWKRYFSLDAQFHQTLYEASGCRLLDKLLAVFWGMLEGYSPIVYPMNPDNLKEFTSQHRLIIEFIVAGDEENIRNCLQKHFNDKEYLLNHISQERKKT